MRLASRLSTSQTYRQKRPIGAQSLPPLGPHSDQTHLDTRLRFHGCESVRPCLRGDTLLTQAHHGHVQEPRRLQADGRRRLVTSHLASLRPTPSAGSKSHSERIGQKGIANETSDLTQFLRGHMYWDGTTTFKQPRVKSCHVPFRIDPTPGPLGGLGELRRPPGPLTSPAPAQEPSPLRRCPTWSTH